MGYFSEKTSSAFTVFIVDDCMVRRSGYREYAFTTINTSDHLLAWQRKIYIFV